MTNYSGRPLDLKKAISAIHAHELQVSRALLSALQAVPELTIFDLTDANRLDERVATYSFCLKNMLPRKVAEELAK